MPKITKIEQQKKNPDRVNIYTDGKFSLGLKKTSLLEAGLKKDQEITEEDLKRLKQKDIEDKNWDRVLRYLSYRPRSEQELRRYLNKKRVPSAEIDLIIKRLKNLDYLNDLSFASWWVEQRVVHKPRGRILLYKELAQKGVPKEIINQTLNNLAEIIKEREEIPEQYSDDPETYLAYKAAKKKAHRYNKKKTFEAKRALSSYLYRRGFTWDQINKVVDTFISEG